ncbi:MAG: hypothetical protein IJO92_03510 [Clostridia bacterium]|nr:hypothetical protein [Clostridia bacterium]
MNLKKRDCGVKIKLKPLGAYYLSVHFDFYGNEISFEPSSAVGLQFGDFLCALYTLYRENGEGHSEWTPRKYHTENGTNHVIAVSTTIDWDNEGEIMTIEMTKHYEGGKINDLFFRITTDYGETYTEFSVNEKDFCYAVAKACTEVLKEYGFYGYRYSTEYDSFNLNHLIFIKAYALDCLEVREFKNTTNKHTSTGKTNFNKEIELLLFDM